MLPNQRLNDDDDQRGTNYCTISNCSYMRDGHLKRAEFYLSGQVTLRYVTSIRATNTQSGYVLCKRAIQLDISESGQMAGETGWLAMQPGGGADIGRENYQLAS